MKRGTPRHPKLQHLAELLKCSMAEAVGTLELLWHFTAEFAPQGDIGKYDDRRIEAALGWHQSRWRKRGDLIRALSESHWVDINPVHRLIIHDWHDHADESVRKRLTRAGLTFLPVTGEVTGQRQEMSGTLDGSVLLPLPLPEPYPLPEPKPEPLPQSVRDLRIGLVNKRPAEPSIRFEEFWDKYPVKDGYPLAQGVWFSIVTTENEAAVFACLDRYLASDRGGRSPKNPNNWLHDCHRDGWRSDWPKPKQNAAAAGTPRTGRLEPVKPTEDQKSEDLRWLAENDPDPAMREDAKRRLH